MITLQQELEQLLPQITGETLLLHSCCAPCSSYVLSTLSDYFTITLFFYNPNILPVVEYQRRLGEQQRLIAALSPHFPITLVEGSYNPQLFLDAVKGLEAEPEGGRRCAVCFRLRLTETARLTKERGADYFTTTLSVSPHKNAQLLDQIALELADQYQIKRLPSDFKKRGGYQQSIALSKQYDLYRQDWCGCPFSKPSGKHNEQQDCPSQPGFVNEPKTIGAPAGNKDPCLSSSPPPSTTRQFPMGIPSPRHFSSTIQPNPSLQPLSPLGRAVAFTVVFMVN